MPSQRMRNGFRPAMRLAVGAVWCILFVMLSGCGQEDPSIALPATTGGIDVTSSPDSALIILDRLSTGLVTPDTVEDVSAGLHWVTVEREGYTPTPCSLQVLVNAGSISSAYFELTGAALRPVLLESFTNVSCMPCAETNPMLYQLVDETGPDGAVLLEFHTSFPSPLDPFYLAQRTLMDARIALYGVAQAPWIVVEGANALQPSSREVVEAALAAATSTNTVELRLNATLTGAALTCSLSAAAPAAPGVYSLTVFVADDLEEFETAPGANGETEFRHVVRGVLPVPCGLEMELSSTPTLVAWTTELSWRQGAEPVTVVAQAREPDASVTVGLDVQHLP